MDKEISPAVQERIRSLCKRITVAHDLDPEIQEELYGHMEDKLLAYLGGEEKLSADDAFILVREHFGDPAVLKSLLQDAHAFEAHASLSRRILAALIASLGLQLFVATGFMLLTLGFTWWAGQGGLPSPPQGALPFCYLAVLALAAVQLWRLVIGWQRDLDSGAERPWFLRWSIPRLVGVAAVAAILTKLLPWAYATKLMESDAAWFAVVFMSVGGAAFVAHSVAWLWWCDRPPRNARALTFATGAWIAFWLLLMVIPPVELAVHAGGQDPLGDPRPFYYLAQGTVWGTAFPWYLRWAPLNAWSALFLTFYDMATLAGAGYLGRLLYALSRRIRRGAEPAQVA